MFKQLFRQAVAAITVALLFTAGFINAQEADRVLTIKRAREGVRQDHRIAEPVKIDRDSAFMRVDPQAAAASASTLSSQKLSNRQRARSDRASAQAASRWAASVVTPDGIGTGSGDIFELEPNNSIAQNVSLPVNLVGEISFDGDVDFFAFQAFAGERIAIEPFAFRIPRSELIADIALFNAAGTELARAIGDDSGDPLISFVASEDQVLVVGIADADDLGGARFDYLLNITRGVDFEESDEPNNGAAQALTSVPATIFGEIDEEDDEDFYSFEAQAGQTLIVDVDAEIIGSGLDSEISLVDATTGVEYFYNDQNDGDDSRFNIVLPATGRYVIGIGAFGSNSAGFYRLNVSTVSGANAPVITTLVQESKKVLLVAGTGFRSGSVVEVNGRARKTKLLSSGILRAKVKTAVGDVVTVSNPPDDRRSNPLIKQ